MEPWRIGASGHAANFSPFRAEGILITPRQGLMVLQRCLLFHGRPILESPGLEISTM
jgi:hypothetical protein